MTKIKKWWLKKSKEQKRWFLIKSISTVIFLAIGLTFGLISLQASGWSFEKFITNPTVDLVLLILVALIIVCVSIKG